MKTALKKSLITIFKVSYPCPKRKCKGDLMWYKFAGQSDGLNHYDHRCDECGYERCLDTRYPHQTTQTKALNPRKNYIPQ